MCVCVFVFEWFACCPANTLLANEELPADFHKLVNFSMAAHVTPPPLAHTVAETTTLFPDLVTKIGAKGNYDSGDFAALIGGIVSVVLLLMICVIGVLMWCLSRQKGDYVTNETDEKDEDVDSGDGESVGSDAELQSKEPLKAKEEE